MLNSVLSKLAKNFYSTLAIAISFPLLILAVLFLFDTALSDRSYTRYIRELYAGLGLLTSGTLIFLFGVYLGSKAELHSSKTEEMASPPQQASPADKEEAAPPSS